MRVQRDLLVGVALACAGVCGPALWAQSEASKPRVALEADSSPRRSAPRQIATIHWQGVALQDAIARLKPLFNDTVFVDRRVDPGLRVTLDIEASSAEQVVAAIAYKQKLGVARLGNLIYLGPPVAADALRLIVSLRGKEAARLQADLRTSLAGRKRLSWSRLAEPRLLVTNIAQENGWQIVDAERVPFDLWAAGELPELTAAEQLTVLLLGFDLTFQLRPNERAIAIVPLGELSESRAPKTVPERKTPKTTPRTAGPKKQVFTLRVQEKPVGAVLKELGTRLKWSIQMDEAAIRAAGLSLDKRVSFAVENADQEELLDALLTPAGLEYRIEAEQIKVVPGRYSTK